MKEMFTPIIKALIDSWYPEPKEGEKRKVKVNPAGVALVAVVILAGQQYFLSQKVDALVTSMVEVKGQTTLIWNALVSSRIAKAVPSPTPAPSGNGLAFIGGAEASEGDR